MKWIEMLKYAIQREGRAMLCALLYMFNIDLLMSDHYYLHKKVARTWGVRGKRDENKHRVKTNSGGPGMISSMEYHQLRALGGDTDLFDNSSLG